MLQHKKRLIAVAAVALAVIILAVLLSGRLQGGTTPMTEEPVQTSSGTAVGEDEADDPGSAESEGEAVTVELEEDFRIELGENESIGGF